MARVVWILIYALLLSWGATASASLRDPQWYLFAHYTTGRVNYTTGNRDNNFFGGSNAALDLTSAEVRFREGIHGSKTWKFTGSAQFESMRTQVLGAPYFYPRGHLRVAWGRDSVVTEQYRGAVLLQISGGEQGLYDVFATRGAVQESIFRMGVGAGVQFTFRKRYIVGPFIKDRFELTLSAILRRDFGAQSRLVATDVKGTNAMQLEADVVYGLSKKTFFNVRGRYNEELFRWDSIYGAGENYFSNRFFLLDIGFGFKF